MLKLMPTLQEGNERVEREMTYDVLVNDEKIGSFTSCCKTKEEREALYAWADQYTDEYYWGDKEELLRLILSTQRIKEHPQSFVLISNLDWSISADELFTRDENDVCLADQFIMQLDVLRVNKGVDVCYLGNQKANASFDQWNFVIEGLGFKQVSETELERFYVSKYHHCQACEGWTLIEEPMCLACHQEHHESLAE